MKSILNLFSKSPFEPLFQHRMKVQECVSLLRPLFEAHFRGDRDEVTRIQETIDQVESEADKIKTEIRCIVPKGVFLPVNREDLLRYLKFQDDLADTVEDISVLLCLKDVHAPPDLAVEIFSYLDVVLEVCKLGDKTADHLQTLVRSGFRGEEVDKVLDLARKSEIAERKTDKAGLALAKRLFAHEDQMKASDLLLWFRIFDLIGDLADDADKMGEWLRNMLSR